MQCVMDGAQESGGPPGPQGGRVAEAAKKRAHPDSQASDVGGVSDLTCGSDFGIDQARAASCRFATQPVPCTRLGHPFRYFVSTWTARMTDAAVMQLNRAQCGQPCGSAVECASDQSGISRASIRCGRFPLGYAFLLVVTSVFTSDNDAHTPTAMRRSIFNPRPGRRDISDAIRRRRGGRRRPAGGRANRSGVACGCS